MNPYQMTDAEVLQYADTDDPWVGCLVAMVEEREAELVELRDKVENLPDPGEFEALEERVTELELDLARADEMNRDLEATNDSLNHDLNAAWKQIKELT